MMNGVALLLLLTALVSGGVWSPAPVKSNEKEVIVKEGHRVVTVEYEKEGDGTNTKVLISPHEVSSKGFVDAAKEKVKEAASVLPNLGQGISQGNDGDNINYRHGAREIVCDALGKCKHKIARVLGRTKEEVSDKVSEMEEEVQEIGHKAAEVVKGGAHRVKEEGKEKVKQVRETAEKLLDNVRESACSVKEEGKEKARKAGEMAEVSVDYVKDSTYRVKEEGKEKANKAEEMAEKGAYSLKEELKEKAQKAREMAEKTGETVKDGVFSVKEGGKEKAEKAREMAEKAGETVNDSAYKVKEEGEEKAKRAGEMAEKAADTVKTGVDNLKEEGQRKQKELKEIVGRGREVAEDMLTYVFPPNAMDSLMEIVHLLGFSTAFGMSMWITFVSSHILAEALPRQQFGMLQSKLYPVYFRVQTYCIGVALIGHFLSHRKRFFSSGMEMFHGFNLLATPLIALGNWLYLEPQATKVMFERMKLEKEEGRGKLPVDLRTGVSDDGGEPVAATSGRPEEIEVKLKGSKLSEKLKMLNRYSSFLNILTLMSLSWHLVYLGQRLHVNR